MDISQFLLALRARRKAFLLALVVTIVTAVAVSLVVPKKYTAQTILVVDSRDEQAMTPMRIMTLRDRTSYVATQIELIQSGRVATQVSHDLKLAQNPVLREAFEKDTGGVGPIDVWIGQMLLDKLKVTNTASNLISIEYSSNNPKTAADVANGFVKAYLAVALDLRTQPTREAAEWFEGQLKNLQARVSQAQARLTAFQREKGVISADDRVDMDQTRLAELSTQLLAARNATYDAQSRHKQASDLVASGGSPDALPEVMSSPAILAVKADMARAESLLHTASTDLGANHPVYQKYSSEVQSLREKLSAEMKKVVAALGNAAQQARRSEQELQAALEGKVGRAWCREEVEHG